MAEITALIQGLSAMSVTSHSDTKCCFSSPAATIRSAAFNSFDGSAINTSNNVPPPNS
jgi:hypothetical protein